MTTSAARTVRRTITDVVWLSFQPLTAGAFVDGMPWHQAPVAAGFLVFALAGLGIPFAVLSLVRQTVADRCAANATATWRALLPSLSLALLALSATGTLLLLDPASLAGADAAAATRTPARAFGGLLVATCWMLAIRGLLLLVGRLVLDGSCAAARWRSPIVRTVTADVLIGFLTLLCATTIAAVLDAGRDDNDSLAAGLLFAASVGAPLAAIVYVPASLMRQWLLGAVHATRASPVPDARSRDLDVVLSRAAMSAAPLLLAPSLWRTPATLAAWSSCALLVPAVWTVAARRWRWALA